MNLMNIDTALLNEAPEIINDEKYIFIPSKPCRNDYGIMVVYLDMINISLESIRTC